MLKTKIMGILNITPDSFSDGGLYLRPEDALRAIDSMARDGAAVIDIGAESTRPGAVPLSADKEWQRLEPLLRVLPQNYGLEFSLDTRHAATAQKAFQYGIHWINDVSGFCDCAMLEAVADANCKLVVMHSLGIPADKNEVMPESADVVHEILAFARRRIDEMTNMGIKKERIIFDPGIGFGKTAAQSLAIIHGIRQFMALGIPLLVGHSRKSFLGGSSPERDTATLQISNQLATQGVAYLRVHDVAGHMRMLSAMVGQ